MKFSILKYIASFFLFVFCACKHDKRIIENKNHIGFELRYCGLDTICKTGHDSSYRLCLLPVIINFSDDTITLIKSIYGRHDRPENFKVYPKFGINIYKNNKKVEFSFMRGCGNYGYLDSTDFVFIYPNKIMLPFKDSYSASSDFNIAVRVPVTGEVEIEAYYNTLDTCQKNYHPFSDEELGLKSKLIHDELKSCRYLFEKMPHFDLRSNRIKVFLK